MRLWRRRNPSTCSRFLPRLEAFEDRVVPDATPIDVFNVLSNTSAQVSATTTHIAQIGDGEVTLPPAAGSDFSGTSIPADWQVTPWSSTPGGSATVAGGVLMIDGAQAGSLTTYGPGRSLQFRATFTGDPFQHAGFGSTLATGTPWMIFSTGSGGALRARTNGATGTETIIPGNWLGAAHDFQIDWSATGATYRIDGAVVATHTIAIGTALHSIFADFGAGGGKLILDSLTLIPPGYETQFDGTSLPADWTSNAAGAAVSSGQLVVDGAFVGTQATYGPGRSLEFVATFTGDPFQHAGFGTTLGGNTPWMIFTTGSGGALRARTTNTASSTDTLIPGNWVGAAHDFRIDWTASGATYWIDGIQVATHTIAISTPLRPIVSDFQTFNGTVNVDWLRMSPFDSSGSYLSRVLDAGAPVQWTGGSVSAATPSGTSVAITVRMGNTPTPDATWTDFSPFAAAAPLGGSGPLAAVVALLPALDPVPGSTFRYAQYRLDLATTQAGQTPTINSVSISTSNPLVAFTDTTVADFASGTPGIGILADDGPALDGPYTAVLVTGPSHGTLSLNPNGSFVYTPSTDFVGSDHFIYQARNAYGVLSAPRTVTFNVYNPASPTPTLVVADASGPEGSAIPLAISAAAGTNDGSQTLSITIGGVPAGASLSHGTYSAGVWTLSPADLTGLTLTAADNASFALTVTAVAQTIATGATSSTSAVLNVTVDNAAPTAMLSGSGSITYGSAATAAFANPSDASATDAAAGLHYAFALSESDLESATYANSGTAAEATFSLPAGSHTILGRVIDKDGGFTQHEFAVVVNKAHLTVAAADAGRTYNGTAGASFSATVSGFVNGDTSSAVGGSASFTGSAAAAVDAGSYTITPGLGSLTAANYDFTSFVNGTLTIGKAALHVAASAEDRIYNGLQTAGVTLSDDRISGDVLTVSYADALFADKNAGMEKLVTVSGISISGDDAANYTVNTTAVTTADIARAVPVVSWSNPAAITYGTRLGPAQLNATADVPGVFAYQYGSGTALPAGVQAMTVGFTPADIMNYENAGTGVSIVVNQAAPSFDALGALSIAAGTSSITVAGHLSGNAGTLQVPAGSSISVTLNGTTQTAALDPSGNYSVAFNTGGLSAGTHTIALAYAGNANFTSASGSATLTVVASPVNRGPTGRADSYSIAEDGTLVVAASAGVLANDTDPDGDALTVSAVNGAAASVGKTINTARGVVLVNANGSFTYTPGATSDAATDSFTYTVRDAQGHTALATATIAISRYRGVSITGGILRVGGTEGTDLVVSISSGKLWVNGTGTSLSGVNEVRVWGRGGTDIIDLSNLNVNAFISGGTGNDLLIGGNGNDVIIGGEGIDLMFGGNGNDVLAGGFGADLISAGAGNDVLIGGDVGGGSLTTLRAIGTEWAASRSTNSGEAAAADALVTDGQLDLLSGGTGADWFIINVGDLALDASTAPRGEGDVITYVS